LSQEREIVPALFTHLHPPSPTFTHLDPPLPSLPYHPGVKPPSADNFKMIDPFLGMANVEYSKIAVVWFNWYQIQFQRLIAEAAPQIMFVGLVSPIS